jgi:putative DNA primase/helicase
VVAASSNKEEVEKRLTSLLLEGAPTTSLDNLSGNLEGDLLAQMLTQTLIKPRLFHQLKAPEVEWRGTLFATGNNIRVTGDMVRRVLVCNLDSNLERPELRAFKGDPIARIHADRGAYIAAAMVITKAYRCGERVKVDPLNGFAMWSRTVREPLVWLGMPDPIACMEDMRALDPERAAGRELVACWQECIGTGKAMRASEIMDIATATDMDAGYEHPEFRDLLMEAVGVKGQIEAKRLGDWLSKIHGRVFAGYRVDLIRKGTKPNRYKLVRVGEDGGLLKPKKGK